MLTSVGHGRLDRSALAQLLQAAGVEAIVDIRRYPNSRHNPDVASDAMAAWASDAGLGYRWDQRLGGRRTLPSGVAAEDSFWQVRQFAAYAAYTRTAEFGAGFDELIAQAQRQRTAMMCSESVWWRCHRRIVADVATVTGAARVGHLMHDGRVVPHPPSAGVRLRPDGAVVWVADSET